MTATVIITIILCGVILLLLGIIAFLMAMVQTANREYETWYKPVEPIDADYEEWEEAKRIVKEARESTRV